MVKDYLIKMILKDYILRSLGSRASIFNKLIFKEMVKMILEYF